MSFHVASLLGFAFVFSAVTLLASALAGLLWRKASARLRAPGPAAERMGAAAALVLPLVAGMAAVLPLLVHASLWQGRRDHCLRMAGGLHFCFQHGSGWAQSLVAMSFLSVLFVGLGRSAVAGASRLRTARRELRALHGCSHVLPGQPEVRLVHAAQRFCFVVGWMVPTIYVSEAAWDALSDGERHAVLAHERAHATQRDLLLRRFLCWAGALGAPRPARSLLSTWEQATERLCDARAAREVGDATLVASAILALASGRGPVPGASLVESGNDVEDRIHALLRGGPIGDEAAVDLLAAAIRAGVASVLAALVFYDQIHTALECGLAWLR